MHLPRTEVKTERKNRHNRISNAMDEEERLVLQGFDDILKNKNKEKYAKSLVRTTTKNQHAFHRLSTKRKTNLQGAHSGVH